MKLNIADYFDESVYKQCFYFLEYDPEMFLYVNNKGDLSLFCTSDKQASYFNSLFSRTIFRGLFFKLNTNKSLEIGKKIEPLVFTFQNVKMCFEHIEADSEQDLLDFKEKIIRLNSKTGLSKRFDADGNPISAPPIPSLVSELLRTGYKMSPDFFSNLPLRVPEEEI